MEEFKGKSNQELKEELNNLNEMQEFLKDEIDDEDMKKEYDDNQEKIDYLTKVVSDEPISVPEPSSESQMDETILVAETEMGKPKDIKVPEIPKDLFFADGGMTKKYFVPRYVKDKISPNFLNVYIDYPTPSGVQVAYGKETMSGQQRRLGSEKAMNIAKEIVKDIKEKHRHNLEDIDYFDNERGKVTIFAVSDDFEDTNFALGGYLTSAGIGAYYGAKNPKSVKKVTDPIDKAISQIGKNLTDKKFAKGGKVGRYTSDDMPKFLENIFGKEYIDNVLIQKDQMDINFKDDGFFVGNRDIKAVEKKGWTFDSLSTYGTSGISLLFTRKSYAKGGALSKEFKFDKNFVIYVPSTTDVGNKISKKELDKRVGEVEKYVANEFGGYTETDTDGGYKSTSGEIIEEDIVKVSVFANNKDWKENESKVVSKVKEWATKWGQEAIGFEYEGDLYYIDEEGKFAKGGMTEKDKLDEAIKHFEDKIKKQGRITNARDEEQLSRLKELRKSFAEGGEVESSSELYDTYFEKYPYATELVAYYIYDYKDDNDIYNMEIGKYGKPIDITPYSELMLDYENTWKDKMPELDEQVKELIDNESMETGMFAKGGKLKGKKIINFYYDVYNNPNRYEDRDNSKLDGEYKKAFELAMANVKKDKKEGTYEFNKPYAKGGEIGDNVIVETDTKSLWRGKKLKGEIVSLSPFKIRTGPTSTSVIPDKLIKSVKSYAKGGEVITDSFGDKYELREDEEININDYVYFGDTGDISVVEDEEDLEFARAGKTKAIPYAKGGEIKVGDYVSVNAGYGMKHIGKVNSKHHMHNDRVYVDGIGDALEIKRLTKVKPPIMAKGGEIAHQEIIEWLEKHPELDGYNEDGTPTDETYQDAIEEIKAERGYAKGGEVKKKGNEEHNTMLIGGIAGILLGIFLGRK